jgi:predicted DNA-binding WGR domain protein
MPPRNIPPINKSEAIATTRLIKVDAAQNNNKFWCAWLLPDGQLFVEYGRVGANPTPYLYPTTSIPEGQAKLNKLVAGKTKDGYAHAVVEQDGSDEAIDWNQFGEAGVSIIKDIDRALQIERLIKPLIQVRFDREKGTWESPLGRISPQTLVQARQVLRQVSRAIGWSRTRPPAPANPQAFASAAEEYLKIIQIPAGMKLDLQDLLGTSDRIQRQESALKKLEEGLGIIARIRQDIQDLAQTLNADNRSAWVHWGEESGVDGGLRVTVDGDDYEDEEEGSDRTRFISWS